MTSSFSRAGLLRRGAAGGGALLVSGSAVSALASSAAAATISDNDLSYLRVLIGAELLDIDFQTQALASGKLDSASSALFKQMLGDENAHYRGLSNLMTGAGQVPATSDDITFTYPKGSFDSQASIMKLADVTGGAHPRRLPRRRAEPAGTPAEAPDRPDRRERGAARERARSFCRTACDRLSLRALAPDRCRLRRPRRLRDLGDGEAALHGE